VESVALHEFGHWISLGHEPDNGTLGYKPSMFPSFGFCEMRRVVTTDDSAGLAWAYGSSTVIDLPARCDPVHNHPTYPAPPSQTQVMNPCQFDPCPPFFIIQPNLDYVIFDPNEIMLPWPKSIARRAPVSIPIHIKNTQELRGIVVPLIIREITPGSFITSLEMSYGDRLPEGPGQPLSDMVVKYQYAEDDGLCQPGGFATVTYSDGGPNPVAASPEGVLFARLRTVSPPLLPGEDVTGSLILTVEVTGTDGSFEIDTTCVDPDTRLTFVPIGGELYTPEFIKGTVTIVSCDCPNQADFDGDGFITAVDLGDLVDILFAGEPDIKDPNCPANRSDFNCDGFPDAVDLASLIDHLFSGGQGPCNPCGCDPYPTNCPGQSP
jgi:hypothetical protein